MQTMGPLHGQIALVTGASSGIGKGIALALAQAGAHVAVNYHSSREDGEEVVGSIRELGNEAIAVGADIASEKEVVRMIKDTIAHFKRLDILVNNAGIQADASLIDMSLEDWQKVIDVNLTGQFLCAREAVRQFLDQEKSDRSNATGKIIFISSVHQRIPWAGRSNYAASKGGLDMFMRSIAQEYAREKIRVNSIAPGAVRTEINEHEWITDAGRKSMIEKIPYGRIGEVEDIGRVAAWLASDEADYITGATIFVDGGMTNYPAFMGS